MGRTKDGSKNMGARQQNIRYRCPIHSYFVVRTKQKKTYTHTHASSHRREVNVKVIAEVCHQAEVCITPVCWQEQYWILAHY